MGVEFSEVFGGWMCQGRDGLCSIKVRGRSVFGGRYPVWMATAFRSNDTVLHLTELTGRSLKGLLVT